MCEESDERTRKILSPEELVDMFFKWAEPSNTRPDLACIPYISGLTEPLSRLLRNNGIRGLPRCKNLWLFSLFSTFVFLVRSCTLLFQYLLFSLFYVTRVVGRFLHRGRAGIRVVTKSHKTLQHEFPSPKFTPPIDLQTNVVYKISNNDCSWNYIDETGRFFFNSKKRTYQECQELL